MARLLGPDPGTRLALRVTASRQPIAMPGKTLIVYVDEACTTLADIAVFDPDNPDAPGAAIPGSVVRVSRESMIPLFWFPDAVDTVWAKARDDSRLRLVADLGARLDAAEDSFLPNVDPQLVNTTLLVRKEDDSAGLRVRTTGSAVDVEKGDSDIIVSTWSGDMPGEGDQTSLQRWRGDGNTFVGKTVFGAGAYSEEMAVDVPNGTAVLGGKNGMETLRFCGRKTTAGAPGAGAWAAGDLIIDSAGVWHLCTAAGTPGSWT